MLRILAGTFAVAYLLVRLPAFLALADAPARSFHPVGLLSPLGGPWSATTVRASCSSRSRSAWRSPPASGSACPGPPSRLALLLLCTYRSSWGQLLHFENLWSSRC